MCIYIYEINKNKFRKLFSFHHLIHTIIRCIQILVFLVLCLAILTYDLWILLTIFGGTLIGYFIFGVNISFNNFL